MQQGYTAGQKRPVEAATSRDTEGRKKNISYPVSMNSQSSNALRSTTSSPILQRSVDAD